MKRRTQNRIKYKLWCRQIKEDYGSVTAYIYKERLHWDPLPSSLTEDRGLIFAAKNPVPFADPDDYKILWNDWPYGSLDKGVKHLVIWLKMRLPADPETGRLLPEHTSPIDEFVDKVFIQRLEQEGFADASRQVCWFKNGYDLQSVGQLEHIHVLLKDVPAEILLEWTHEPEPVMA